MRPNPQKKITHGISMLMIFVLLSGVTSHVSAAPGDLARISVDSSGAQANGSSRRDQLSADGRYVAFTSEATNLVADDTNNMVDVFVKDRQTGATTRVSLASLTGEQANNHSGNAAISNDGRYVALSSGASNLVSGDINGVGDIFVRDRQTGLTTRVSIDSSGLDANRLINLKGITQLRLLFQLDDNDDLGEDNIRFYSGDANQLLDRPHLQIDYYVPR